MLRLCSLRTVTRFDRAFCTLANEEKSVIPRKTFHAINPSTGQTVPQIFEEATADGDDFFSCFHSKKVPVFS